MNEAIISHFQKQHKLITDSLGFPSVEDTLNDENERLYADSSYSEFRVSVTVTRQGFMTLLATDAKAAEQVAQAAAAFSDDIEEAVQTELIGHASRQ